jgi:hypothetical protein
MPPELGESCMRACKRTCRVMHNWRPWIETWKTVHLRADTSYYMLRTMNNRSKCVQLCHINFLLNCDSNIDLHPVQHLRYSIILLTIVLTNTAHTFEKKPWPSRRRGLHENVVGGPRKRIRSYDKRLRTKVFLPLISRNCIAFCGTAL